MQKTKVLILAAGVSHRMRPIGDKSFLEFLGKPLIERQLMFLKKNGFEDIVVVGRDMNIEKIREVELRVGVKVQIAEQKDDKGMCGAVLAAKEFIGESPLLIFCSNDVVDDSALELVRGGMNEEVDGLILGKKVEKYFPGGYLEVNAEGLITNLIEKPGEGNEPSDLVNLVVHWYREPAKLIEHLEKAESEKDDIYETAIVEMIKGGAKVKALPYSGFWQPIKYPWHVHNVFQFYLANEGRSIANSAKIAENAVIDGDVVIGENVKIFEGAVIKGPAYIGDNSVVANNALVRGSHIGADCMVGFSTEVARSFWGNKVWTHMNYVGDSVIGNDVSFGAGAVTGNLRLDDGNVSVMIKGEKVDTGEQKVGSIIGDGVRVGINTSIMPGVKIGGGAFVGAGIVVAQDVEENTFVRGDWQLKISEKRI